MGAVQGDDGAAAARHDAARPDVALRGRHGDYGLVRDDPGCGDGGSWREAGEEHNTAVPRGAGTSVDRRSRAGVAAEEEAQV